MTLTTNRHSIRLAAALGSSALRDQLRQALRGSTFELGLELAASAGEIGGEELPKLREARPEVIILDLGPDPSAGIRLVQHLAEGDPALQIVALGPRPTPEFLLEAMRAGVTEYLPTSAAEEELPGVLGRLARKLRRGGEIAREPAKIYTLVSAKGGAGKTTVATNLAVELHRLSGKRTLLVDLELELGETALMLGLQPRFSFLDLVKNYHRMDANLLSSYIERHHSGVELLAAPVQLERDAVPSRDEVRSVLNFLKQHYDYIVVDTPKSLPPAALAAIEESDLVILLTTPDLPALRNTKRWLPLLEARVGGRAQGQPDRIRLLVNRYSPVNVITLEDITRTLELPVSWKLSSDYEAISHAINRGEPVVLNGNSRYAKELSALSTELGGIRTEALEVGGGYLASLTAQLRGVWRRVAHHRPGGRP
jgi:pilus assembly protein CpaE